MRCLSGRSTNKTTEQPYPGNGWVYGSHFVTVEILTALGDAR
jgi:hypothetical protein